MCDFSHDSLYHEVNRLNPDYHASFLSQHRPYPRMRIRTKRQAPNHWYKTQLRQEYYSIQLCSRILSYTPITSISTSTNVSATQTSANQPREHTSSIHDIMSTYEPQVGSLNVFVPSLLLSNVMSLAPKIDEVRSVAAEVNLDIICIVESWLQTHIHDNIVHIDNYNIIRRDRSSGIHGGVCAYIRKTIKFKTVDNLLNENFEVLWLKLNPTRLPRGIPNIILGVLYHPPSANDHLMINYLLECLTCIEVQFPNSGIIIAGDFNKLNITRLRNGFKLKQLTKFPTRGHNFLDLILTNLDNYYKESEKFSPFGLSDHASVVIKPLTHSEVPKPTFKVKFRDTRPSKRLALSQYLEQVNIQRLLEEKTSCEDKVKTLELIINYGLDTLLPVRTKVKCVNDPPWISSKLRQLIRQRQKNLKQGNFITFRRLRNEVNRERKSCRPKFYDAKVKELKESAPNRWWKEVKKLSGMSDQVADPGDVTSLLRNLETDSEDLTSIDWNPIQLANLINKTFLEPMQDFNPLSPSSLYEERTTSTFHVSEYQIFKSLSSLRPRKATGPDGIPGWVLRENADILARPISGIINQSYHETHLPESWKCANIAPIPKEKPVRIINKHLRPISLTPIISKIAESFVVDIFVKPAVIKKIDQNQFGTIPNSSTVHALISMLHEWNGSTDGNGGTTRVVLFDFRKAFDLIDHHLLVQKLKTYDLPPWTIDWITDFITCRKQRVKLNRDCYSDWELVPAGVPQGTILGPWLFIIMMNDIEITSSDNWKYVDDTTISEYVNKGEMSNIQSEVDEFTAQAQANKFQFNEGKCKELRIGFSSKPTQFDPISINDKSLEVVDHAKILGITKKARKRL